MTKSFRSINSVEGSPLINRIDNYNSDLRIELSGKFQQSERYLPDTSELDPNLDTQSKKKAVLTKIQSQP